MKDVHKKYTKIEFIKHFLSENTEKKCEFCKYNFLNYKNISTEYAKIFRKNKCINCKHLPMNTILMKDEGERKKRMFLDNFKPLYEWEDYGKGEQNA